MHVLFALPWLVVLFLIMPAEAQALLFMIGTTAALVAVGVLIVILLRAWSTSRHCSTA